MRNGSAMVRCTNSRINLVDLLDLLCNFAAIMKAELQL